MAVSARARADVEPAIQPPVKRVTIESRPVHYAPLTLIHKARIGGVPVLTSIRNIPPAEGEERYTGRHSPWLRNLNRMAAGNPVGGSKCPSVRTSHKENPRRSGGKCRYGIADQFGRNGPLD